MLLAHPGCKALQASTVHVETQLSPGTSAGAGGQVRRHWEEDGKSWRDWDQPKQGQHHPGGPMARQGPRALPRAASGVTLSCVSQRAARLPGDQHSCLPMLPGMNLSLPTPEAAFLLTSFVQERDQPRSGSATPRGTNREHQSTTDHRRRGPCPPQTALGSCSPLVALARAVQGQLGVVTRNPLPP